MEAIVCIELSMEIKNIIYLKRVPDDYDKIKKMLFIKSISWCSNLVTLSALQKN
jgi:hypothetical protein